MLLHLEAVKHRKAENTLGSASQLRAGLMRAFRSPAVVVLVALAVSPAATSPQAPTADVVVARAAAYSARYVAHLSNVVLEEQYLQEVAGISRVVSVTPLSQPQVITPPGRRRELLSDVVLVRVGPPLEWRSFRDVYKVDGQVVRDRQDRLTRLILEPAAMAQAQALRIETESARFNISDVGRTLNVPGIPLLFLQSALLPRFRWQLERRDGGVGQNTWILRYAETARPTLFQHNATLDNPSSGRIWVDVGTGVVLRTEHVVTPPKLRVSVTTQFRLDVESGVAIPTEMREQVSGSTGSIRSLEGVAKYSNVRHFQVQTDEAVGGPGLDRRTSSP